MMYEHLTGQKITYEMQFPDGAEKCPHFKNKQRFVELTDADAHIETKYDIGDKVYIAECYNGEFYPSKPLIINTVYTETTKYDTRVYYQGSYYGEKLRRREDHYFGSYEECIKWCNENNDILLALPY